MKELIVASGETVVFDSNIRRLDHLEIRKDGTLLFDTDISFFVNNLVALEGAKIIYKTDQILNNPSFTMYCSDASGLNDLTFIGNGKDGAGYPEGAKAGNGRRGDNAKSTSFKYPNGLAAESGGNGINGGAGQDGEDAVDFTIHLPALKSGAVVSIFGNGGNGGNGQSGGNGGRGGDGTRVRREKKGGNGGHGGDAGSGGDASQLQVFLILDDDKFENENDRNALIDFLKLNANVSPGKRGKIGSRGTGGDSGLVRGPSRGAEKGRDGVDGSEGFAGDGPSADTQKDWITVSVMPNSRYATFVSQVLSGL